MICHVHLDVAANPIATPGRQSYLAPVSWTYRLPSPLSSIEPIAD